jgi:hypothetical protein
MLQATYASYEQVIQLVSEVLNNMRVIRLATTSYFMAYAFCHRCQSFVNAYINDRLLLRYAMFYNNMKVY